VLRDDGVRFEVEKLDARALADRQLREVDPLDRLDRLARGVWHDFHVIR
jgi:hypothetical protein